MSEPAKNSLFSEALRDELRDILRDVIKEELGKSKPTGAEEKLLDPDKAAKVLDVSVDWLYHHAKQLPFTRKLGPKMLRFSYAGMLRWMKSKKFS